MDMSPLKKEFPSQVENRKQWILDTVRGNPVTQAFLIQIWGEQLRKAQDILDGMQRMDRDALLQPGGVLTNDEIESVT